MRKVHYSVTVTGSLLLICSVFTLTDSLKEDTVNTGDLTNLYYTRSSDRGRQNFFSSKLCHRRC